MPLVMGELQSTKEKCFFSGIYQVSRLKKKKKKEMEKTKDNKIQYI